MSSLTLAVQANQALALPPLLLVAYLQHVKSVDSISVKFKDAAAINDNGAVVVFDAGKGRVTADTGVLPCLMEVYALAEGGDDRAVSSGYLSKAFYQPGAVFTNRS